MSYKNITRFCMSENYFLFNLNEFCSYNIELFNNL